MKNLGIIGLELSKNPKNCKACMEVMNKLANDSSDSDELIYGCTPLLLIGDLPESFMNRHIEELVFDLNSLENEAGQSLDEILDLLALRVVYLFGDNEKVDNLLKEKRIKVLR